MLDAGAPAVGPTSTTDEAIEWIKRSPFEDGEVEIRPLFEAEDFGDQLTPELRQQEERQRAQIAASK
jgi:hypothetical protein